MANIIKVLRTLTAGLRPSGRTYGEPYVNFSDNQFGVLDSGNNPRDLIGVPFFSSSTTYSAGQPVVYQGHLYIANTNIAVGAWNPLQWNLVTSQGKNYIVNGAMMISQQNGTTAGAVNGYYPVDQFSMAFAVSGGAISGQMLAGLTPAGSPYRIRTTVTTAVITLAAADIAVIQTSIEGQQVADLRFGLASARQITLQFGVKAPAGTYCVSFVNGPVSGPTRSYVAEYVITPGEANTDVVKRITLTGDLIGTWATDNTNGLIVRWCFGAGSNYYAPVATWTTGNFHATANQFNLFGTVNNIFELFDVGLYAGSIPPPFTVPDYASELVRCQRYYENDSCLFQVPAAGALITPTTYKVTKRVTPTIYITNTSGAATVSLNTATIGTAFFNVSATAANQYVSFNFISSARM